MTASPSHERDARGSDPGDASRRRRVLLASLSALAALLVLGSFVLAVNTSNHLVLSNGVAEHRGALDAPVWLPPSDVSWDTPPPSPAFDDAHPSNRPAAVDPLLAPGEPAPRTPTTPTSPPQASGEAPAAESPPPPAAVSPATAAAVALLNDARAGAGCAPLRVDARLVDAAGAGAGALATGAEGSEPATRMRAAGYPAPGGENVARGQALLEEATAQLLASSAHRANILDCSFIRVGIAHATGLRGDYWVQDFGR